MAFVQVITFNTNNNHFGTIQEFYTLTAGLQVFAQTDAIRDRYIANGSILGVTSSLLASNLVEFRREFRSPEEFDAYRLEIENQSSGVVDTFGQLGWTKTGTFVIE